jgi:sugar phosphate isomerase/epimerase
MNLSIGTTFNYAIPLKEQLPRIRAAGFTHVSLGGGDLGHSGYLDPERRKDLNLRMTNNGIRICSIHVPFRAGVDISAAEPGPAQAALDLYKQCIDAAEELSAAAVIFHPGPDRTGDDVRRKDILTGQMTKLAEYIGSRNIKLAVENLRNEFLNGALGHSLDMIRNPKYGLCFDTSHDNLTSRPLEILKKYGGRMIATHVSDNNGREDDHLLPFEGGIDWKKFSGIFARIKFSGPFLLEVEMRESAYKDPDEFLRQAFTRGQKLLDLIRGQAPLNNA